MSIASPQGHASWKLITAAVLMVLLATALLVFNRSPHRTIPETTSIISPANGTIIAIDESKDKDISFFKDDVLNSLHIAEIEPPFKVVVIEMNLKNVHVQRTPIAGTMIAHHYFPGKFKNALYSENREHLVNENEKMLSIFKNEEMSVGVVQVAGIVARRIKINKRDGDVLEKGEMYGRITFGSQVVAVLPSTVDLAVKVGDTVIDGESVLATY